jgi:hypothetical protein
VSVSVPLSVNGYPAAGSDPRLPFGVRDRCAYAGHTSSAAGSVARHRLSPFGHVASDVIPSIELLGSARSQRDSTDPAFERDPIS